LAAEKTFQDLAAAVHELAVSYEAMGINGYRIS
jgi:hypothetical protein